MRKKVVFSFFLLIAVVTAIVVTYGVKHFDRFNNVHSTKEVKVVTK